MASPTAAARRAPAAGGLARYFALIAFVVALLLFAAPVGAFFNPPSQTTLQWLVESTPLVVRGTIRPGMCRAVANSSPLQFQVTLDVDQTIKGDRHEQITFTTPAMDGLTGDNRSWLDVLVFLHPAADSTAANANSGALNGWTVDANNLFVLTDHTHPIYQLDGSTVSSGEALMQATLAAAKFAADRGKACEQTGVYISAIKTSLIVPFDSRIEEIGRAWIKDPSEQKRVDGLSIIGHFNSPKNAELLRGVVGNDPVFKIRSNEHWSPYLDDRWWRDYPVRLQAFTILSYWNQAQSEDIRFLLPLLRYSPVRWWPIVTALAVIIVIACWRLKGRGVAAAMTVIMLGLAAMVGSCWWRSARAPSTLSFARAGADVELVSHRGRLALLRVQDDAPPHGWSIRRLDAGESLRWFGEYLDDREAGRYGPFAWSQGTTTGNSFSYNLVELPYWAVFGALMLWPACRGMRRVTRKMRSRQRVKANCCAVCGYDLRGSSDKCPECGTVRVRWSKATMLVAGVMAILFANDSRAFVIREGSRSLQINVSDADLVIRGRFKLNRQGAWPAPEVNHPIQVLETIKGQRFKSIDYFPPDMIWHERFKRAGAQTEWLFCFRNLAGPGQVPTWSVLSWQGGIYCLDGREKLAYDIDGSSVADAREILNLTRDAAVRPHDRTELFAGWFRPDSPLGSIRYGSLTVPVDERLERLAIGWSCDADVVYRAAAARVLRLYKSSANHQRLHRLLSDPGYTVVPTAEWERDRDQRTLRLYPAREQAAAALREWGIDVTTTVVDAGRPYRSPDWGRPAAGLVLLVSLLTLFRRRGSSGAIRRLVVGMSLFFLVVTTMLDWRSRYGSDSLAFSVAGTSYEVSSAAGKFYVLRVDDRSPAAAPALRSDSVHAPWFDTDLCLPGLRPTSAVAPTYTKLLLPAGEAAGAGFAASWGSVASAGVYPYRLTIVPDWFLCAVFAVPLGLAGLGMVRERRRRRLWRRRGCCIACGYDLRGSKGRCPECGGHSVISRFVMAAVLLLFCSGLRVDAQPADGSIEQNLSMYSADAPLVGTLCMHYRAPRVQELPHLASIEAQVAMARVIVRAAYLGSASAGEKFRVTEVLKGKMPAGFVMAATRGLQPHDRRCEYIFCLTSPNGQNPWDYTSGWRLNGDENLAFAMDGRPIHAAAELLSAVRGAIAHDQKRPWPAEFTLLHLQDFPPWFPLNKVSHSNFLVPVDDRLEAMALPWLESELPALRVVGIEQMELFPTGDNIAKVRRLFLDPAYFPVPLPGWEPDVDRRERHYHFVRVAAAKMLGERDADGPIYETDHVSYFPVEIGKPIAILLGAMMAGAVLPRGKGFARRALRAGLFTLGLGMAMLWWRSADTGDDLNWAGEKANYEISSIGGHLSLLRVEDTRSQQSLVLRSMPLDAGAPRRPWYASMLSQTAHARWLGLATSSGDIIIDPPPMTRDYSEITVPHWPIAAILLAWPVLAWMAAAMHSIRHLIFRYRGHCPFCGYNLRGSNSRCPECGRWAISTIPRREDITASMEPLR